MAKSDLGVPNVTKYYDNNEYYKKGEPDPVWASRPPALSPAQVVHGPNQIRRVEDLQPGVSYQQHWQRGSWTFVFHGTETKDGQVWLRATPPGYKSEIMISAADCGLVAYEHGRWNPTNHITGPTMQRSS